MEENLYDTSRLIDAYKKREKIRGLTTIFNILEFPKALDLDLDVIYPSKADYDLALKISLELLRVGKPVPIIDVIISAIAINNNLRVVTKDRHFLEIRNIEKRLKVNVEDLHPK